MVSLTAELLGSVPRRTGRRLEGASIRTLRSIIRSLGAGVRDDELGPRVYGLALPGIFGPPVILVHRCLRGQRRRLVLAHELAHLAAGELAARSDGAAPLAASFLDKWTVSERRADLFALAVVLPDQVLSGLGAGRVRDSLLRTAVSELLPSYPPELIRDRARLRVLLFERAG